MKGDFREQDQVEQSDVTADELRTVEASVSLLRDVINPVAKAVKEVNTWKATHVNA